ncbi:MAG TPA: nucleotidyltransferase family protein [Dehalococcoidia bacterium]|nr:nucleotidyltransferase family protein [Dehalococcoidia bacterium]
MKAVILAGGFGTRLWPLTKYIPKALLPVGGKPIIDFHIEQILVTGKIDDIVVSTNANFEAHFRYWQQKLPMPARNMTRLVVEPSRNEKEKPGAIKALLHILTAHYITSGDLVTLAGDNLFGFQLADFISFFYSKGRHPSVAFCDLRDINKVKQRYGVATLDNNGKLVSFEEKPSEPKCALASTACYVYPPDITEYIREYIENKNNPDALGYFISWLHRKTDVYGFVFEGPWFDIGSFDSYEQANQYYTAQTLI